MILPKKHVFKNLKQNLPTIVQTVTMCRIFWHDMRKLTNDDDFKGYLVEGTIKEF